MSILYSGKTFDSVDQYVCCLQDKIGELEQQLIIEKDNLLFFQLVTIILCVLLVAALIMATFVTPVEADFQLENQLDVDNNSCANSSNI